MTEYKERMSRIIDKVERVWKSATSYSEDHKEFILLARLGLEHKVVCTCIAIGSDGWRRDINPGCPEHSVK